MSKDDKEGTMKFKVGTTDDTNEKTSNIKDIAAGKEDKEVYEFRDEEVKKNYEAVKCKPGPVVWKNREIDTRKINAKRAEELIKEGFPYLRKKEDKA